MEGWITKHVFKDLDRGNITIRQHSETKLVSITDRETDEQIHIARHRLNDIAAVLLDIVNDAQPSDSHNSWLAEKEADGWTYGPVKNPGLKTHPCIVPYSALPEEQKAKDIIFRAIASALLPVHEDVCRSFGQTP